MAKGEISFRSTYVKKMEANLRTFFDVEQAFLCSNGYAAILVVLKLEGIGKGDEVIIPSFTMAAVGNAVIDAGA